MALVDLVRVRASEVETDVPFPNVEVVLQAVLGGDVRRWGAKCDGVTNDTTAILNAIAATNGKIIVPGNAYVTSHVLFDNITNASLIMENNAEFVIGTDFNFHPNYRAVVEFRQCNGVYNKNVRVSGAKIDKLNATEPWQDGDCGIEYLQCSGNLYSENANIRNVKTWGIMHVECTNADSVIVNPVVKNAQVQSGIGGTGYRSLRVVNPYVYDVGLYGIELETRQRNIRTVILGGIIELCNKGVATVHNTDNVMMSGIQVVNCNTGLSILSTLSTDTDTYIGVGGLLSSNLLVSCGTGIELVNPKGVVAEGNRTYRAATEYFVRTRALDRIVKMSGGKAYVALDSLTENPNITVGMVIQLDDGTQYTVASVDAATDDAVFRKVVGFTTTTAMPSSALRSSFRRYKEVVSNSSAVVLYEGDDVVIKGNHFGNAVNILTSYGAHSKLIWKQNTSANSSTMFSVGSGGSVSGDIVIESGDNPFLGSLGSTSKFKAALNATKTFSCVGGSNNSATTKLNGVPVPTGVVTGARVVLNNDATTSGTIVFRLNGTDAIAGGFSGTPRRVNGTFEPISVQDAAVVSVVDTVGDLVTSGWSVELRGAFL